VTEALACPCVADLKGGPCGPLFVAAFSCFHLSTSQPRGCDCLQTDLALAVSRHELSCRAVMLFNRCVRRWLAHARSILGCLCAWVARSCACPARSCVHQCIRTTQGNAFGAACYTFSHVMAAEQHRASPADGPSSRCSESLQWEAGPPLTCRALVLPLLLRHRQACLRANPEAAGGGAPGALPPAPAAAHT
jgi:hypothetical protein